MVRSLRNKLYSAWDLWWIKLDFSRSSLRSRFSLWFQGCEVGKGFRTSGKCCFKASKEGSIRIGDSVSLLAGHRSNRVGLSNPVLIETFGDGIVEIGKNSGASAVVISSRTKVSIGEHVKVGGNVRIFDHDYHSMNAAIRRTESDVEDVKSSPVIIEDNVFIGTNAIILKGVHIGARSIIGAGAVVSGREIPPDSVVAGNPAHILSRKGGE